jgi:hypothetical protein
MKTETLTVFVLVDSGGDYVVSDDRDTLLERWDEKIGGDAPTPSRVIELTLAVVLPSEVKLAADVPAENAKATLSVVA